MYMSAKNVQKRSETDLPVLNGDGVEQETSPRSRSNSPVLSSGASSVDRQPTERSNSSDRAGSCNGIVEVSDKDDDEEEVPPRQGPMSLGNFRRPQMHAFLMPCGHPMPPPDLKQIKRWVGNGRNWCATCNPLLAPNIVRSGTERSGWRRTMQVLIERNVLPVSVLNLNETFVYLGNNGNEINLTSANGDEAPFMYDLEMFLKVVCANDLCRIPLRALTCLRSFIHSDSRILPFFQKIHPLSLCHFSTNLLETAIRLMEEPCETSEVAFRRSKTALQCFYQTAARVPFFRETIYKHQLSQWLNLLRIEFLRHDVILCVLVVIREMHTWFFRSDDLYVRLLSDLIVLWGSPAVIAEHRSFVTNIFIVLFDQDPDFLYDSLRMMDREIFSELLVILESALNFAPICRLRDYEFNISPKVCLNPTNLSFCLELLECVDKEMSECRQPRYDVSIRLTMLVDVINLCAASRGTYDQVLHKNQKAISLMCGVMKALMFAQREVGTLLTRAQYMMNNTVQNATNQNHAPNRQRVEISPRSPAVRPSRKPMRSVPLPPTAYIAKRTGRKEVEDECEGESDFSEEEEEDEKQLMPAVFNSQKVRGAKAAVEERENETVPRLLERKKAEESKSVVEGQENNVRRPQQTKTTEENDDHANPPLLDRRKDQENPASNEGDGGNLLPRLSDPLKQVKPSMAPPTAKVAPFIVQVDGEPLRKHARMDSNSSNEALPDSGGQNEQSDVMHMDTSADSEERKPLISPISDCSSSSDETPKLNTKKRFPLGVDPAGRKTTPLGAQQTAALNISNKTNNCYEEMEEDEEEEASDDDLDLDADSSSDEIEGNISTHVEGIFGPRAETLFAEYMTERPPDFTLEMLNEDELLIGLPHFRSIQPIFQMVVGRTIPPHLFSSLKQSTLRAISNLCRDSPKNQLVAGRLDAIPLVLQCSMRQEGDGRSGMLAIVTLKSLVWSCTENQDRLLDITEGCSQFIDRDRLFSAMDLRVEIDGDGRARLVPLVEAAELPDEKKAV